MPKTTINVSKLVNYWLNAAEHDLEVAKSLWRSKKYDACLFFCHLVLEKTFKGIITKDTKSHPAYTHNLLDLARKSSIATLLTKKQLDILTDIILI